MKRHSLKVLAPLLLVAACSARETAPNEPDPTEARFEAPKEEAIKSPEFTGVVTSRVSKVIASDFDSKVLRLNIRSGKQVGANQINLAYKSEGAFLGGKVQGAKAVGDLQKPAGEWNEWRVLAVGDKLTFWCNGTKAWEGTGLEPEKGYIGLQAEGAALEFQNIRLREVKE